MIPVPSGVRVWLAVGRTDMRRGMNGLALQVQEALRRDPHAGDLYVFRGARGDLIKILWHYMLDGIDLRTGVIRFVRNVPDIHAVRRRWPDEASLLKPFGMMCLSRAAASAAFSAWNRSSGVLKRTSSRTTVPVIARSAAPCRRRRCSITRATLAKGKTATGRCWVYVR